MKQLDLDHYELSTGRTFYANRGIVGLAPNDDTVHEGYDGVLTYGLSDPNDLNGQNALTPSECSEIADFMIAMWEAWKRKNGQ